jgi:hypothetical protein
MTNVEMNEEEFYMAPGTYHALELGDITPIEGEILSDHAKRVLGKAAKGFVIVGDDPLEAIGSVHMTPQEATAFNERISALVPDSIVRLNARLAQREADDTAQAA